MVVANRYGSSILGGLVVLGLLGGPAQLEAVQEKERGWIGIGFDCECTQDRKNEVVVWKFEAPPVVTHVNPGTPGADAGFRKGDSLVAINGLRVTTEEGGREFGALMAGEPVQITVARDGEEHILEVTPGSYTDVFGTRHEYTLSTGAWDSLRVQARKLMAERLELQRALVETRRHLSAIQRDSERFGEDYLETQRQLVEKLELEADSLSAQMQDLQVELRHQVDSLAKRSLYLIPRPDVPDSLVVEVRPAAPSPARPRVRALAQLETPITLTPYANAVAGARFEALNEGLAELTGVEQGLLVLEVVPETPAAEAGLRSGDVVLSVNNLTVSTVSDLRRALRGGLAELEILRKGERMQVEMSPR